ncbi:DUF2789 domain-containing protein [Azotobacter chroococcum]|jgi:hypothetical protein|uniref:DUF2789 domain-containing protein n=1 Tax=Azotobacter chroococcum TaxID=353 RepID=UPI0010AEA1E3|nr:DUF2789 domain-containing protein [Azotobacter chroococcum]TKD46158.1 DUF2789 domain-containing protein [Azotobacter chroococcum]
MEMPIHKLSALFDQLGLKSDPASIDAFIGSHMLPNGIKVSEAPFWSPSQAALLKEELLDDADWAPIVDELNERLHPRH